MVSHQAEEKKRMCITEQFKSSSKGKHAHSSGHFEFVPFSNSSRENIFIKKKLMQITTQNPYVWYTLYIQCLTRLGVLSS